MAGNGGGNNWWREIRRIVAAIRAGRGLFAAPTPPNSCNQPDEVSWIEPGVLAERLVQAAAPIIVDVRGADGFDGDLGHLADARNIALPELPRTHRTARPISGPRARPGLPYPDALGPGGVAARRCGFPQRCGAARRHGRMAAAGASGRVAPSRLSAPGSQLQFPDLADQLVAEAAMRLRLD